jgi:hypothetical protein
MITQIVNEIVRMNHEQFIRFLIHYYLVLSYPMAIAFFLIAALKNRLGVGHLVICLAFAPMVAFCLIHSACCAILAEFELWAGVPHGAEAFWWRARTIISQPIETHIKIIEDGIIRKSH